MRREIGMSVVMNRRGVEKKSKNIVLYAMF